MKLIELAQLKTASLLALLSVIASLSFSPVCPSAAEKAKEAPVTSRSILSSEFRAYLQSTAMGQFNTVDARAQFLKSSIGRLLPRS